MVWITFHWTVHWILLLLPRDFIDIKILKSKEWVYDKISNSKNLNSILNYDKRFVGIFNSRDFGYQDFVRIPYIEYLDYLTNNYMLDYIICNKYIYRIFQYSTVFQSLWPRFNKVKFNKGHQNALFNSLRWRFKNYVKFSANNHTKNIKVKIHDDRIMLTKLEFFAIFFYS